MKPEKPQSKPHGTSEKTTFVLTTTVLTLKSAPAVADASTTTWKKYCTCRLKQFAGGR